MRKVSKLILSIAFCSAGIFLYAQEKYAVLVAVDNYYSSPGVKHHGSLSGCVNDARSIKGLLETRFGFNPLQVYTLYNEKATKKALINQLRVVFQKSKPGDAVVFFFSGHGVWMTNDMLMGDPVKRGMSQAIVMNDLYSPGWDCLVRDETLKEIFNQFVDKKIIVTTIFDCCYSANLLMSFGLPKYWDGWIPEGAASKDMDIRDIHYHALPKQPPGCRFDSAGFMIDTIDSDGDRFPDCMDWEVNTPMNSTVDGKGVLVGEPNADFFGITPDNYYDSSWFTNDDQPADPGSATRSFNLKDALKVSNRSSVRPSERDGSHFASLAGAADNMKGLEIRDISGIKHGAFTAALMMVYKTNPATISINELWSKTEALMRQQSYNQTPGMDVEHSRLGKNLIGTDTAGFTQKIRAKSISIKNKKITLDRGWTAGLSKGNLLTDLNLNRTDKIEIIQAFADSSIALDKSNGRIKPGHLFELTDPYTTSNPHIKLHIPNAPFTPAGYMTFFNSKILPLTTKSNYMDYNYDESEQCRDLLIYRDAVKVERSTNELFEDGGKTDKFCVFLPVPSYIRDQVVALVGKDQNFQLVNDPKQADLVLYINYAKAKPGAQSGFNIYWIPPFTAPHASMGSTLFSELRVVLPTMNVTASQLRGHANSLYNHVKNILRKKTNAWLNFYKRR
jgi:hypothetical protein